MLYCCLIFLLEIFNHFTFYLSLMMYSQIMQMKTILAIVYFQQQLAASTAKLNECLTRLLVRTP